MAVTLDQIQKWRDRLFESRLSGVREVRDQNGESIVYRSESEMARAISAADAAIIAMTKHGSPPHTIHFKTSKGVTS